MDAATPCIDTVSSLMKRNAQRWPNRTAFIFDAQKRSWRELDRLTDAIADSLLALGLERGDHVGCWSLNSLDLACFLIASMKVGIVPAVINYSYRTFELGGVLTRGRIRHLFLGERKHGSDYQEMALRVRDAQLGGDLHIYEIADLCARAAVDAAAPASQLASAPDWRHLEACKARIRPDDVACIAFTSGTTKAPKPVLLTFANIIGNIERFDARMGVRSDDVLMAPLPLFHCSGMTGMLFHALVSGMSAIVLRMFRAPDVLHGIERFRATVLMAVPSMLELLVEDAAFPACDLSSLRVGLVSGAVVSPGRMRSLISRLGITHLLMAYGQTECAPIITTTLLEDDLVTSTETVGLPLPDTELRIWNEQANEPCPPGVVGEIQVRGPSVMRGYFGLIEENRAKFTSDGWLKTTDAGACDARGYLSFSARIGELIIRHGENISPAEIECVVERFSDDVLQAKVVGIPSKLTGEEIVCLVTTRSGSIDADAVRTYVKATLASYKCPAYVFAVDALPMTDTTKVSSVGVRSLAKRLVAEARGEDGNAEGAKR